MSGTPEARDLNRSGDRKMLLALTAITMLGLAAALWVTRGTNPLRSDSPSYLYFDPSRTVGYPAFLWLVRSVTGHVGLAVPVQMVLLAGALLALGWSFYSFSRRPIASLLFQALLIGSPELWKISALIMTEAISTACVAIWCAQLLRMIRAPSLAGAGVLVAISCIGTIVRPPLAALFVASALFALAAGPKINRGRALALVGAGVIAAWAATPVALDLVDGRSTTSSPLARGVLQHTLFCAPSHPDPDPDAAFVERNAAPVRRYAATAPAAIVPVLERIYSGELRFGLIIPALGEWHREQIGWQTDPVMARVAAERVEANPWCYAKSVLAADFRIATYGTSVVPGAAAMIGDFIAAHPPVPVATAPLLADDRRSSLKAAGEFGEPPPYPVPPAEPFRLRDKSPLILVMAARLFYTAAAVVGALSLAALVICRGTIARLRSTIAGAAAAGAAFHGIVAVTAIVELGLTRYTIPLWPIACTLLGIAATMVLDVRGRQNARLTPNSVRMRL
jgi:hypothetical protein